MWYWWVDRHIDKKKKNRIENLEIDLHKYAQLSFDKEAQASHWTRDNFFNKRCYSNCTSIDKNK